MLRLIILGKLVHSKEFSMVDWTIASAARANVKRRRMLMEAEDVTTKRKYMGRPLFLPLNSESRVSSCTMPESD